MSPSMITIVARRLAQTVAPKTWAIDVFSIPCAAWPQAAHGKEKARQQKETNRVRDRHGEERDEEECACAKLSHRQYYQHRKLLPGAHHCSCYPAAFIMIASTCYYHDQHDHNASHRHCECTQQHQHLHQKYHILDSCQGI